MTEDLSSGFAMTIDSFCTGGGVGANIIPYNKIKSVSYGYGLFSKGGVGANFIPYNEMKNVGYGYSHGLTCRLGIVLSDNKEICYPASYSDEETCKKLFDEPNYSKIEKFLKVAKNF